ncbi:MAG: four helix bundle protein [Rickettsiales bacterium]|nr:four helix bundle protein [Rickettsiales bacterium]
MAEKQNKGFENLEVWKYSINLIKEIYLVTKNYPKEEVYGLTAQIRRSAISIASNISEGSAKSTYAEFARFISIALGSCAELKCQVIISYEIGYLDVMNKNSLAEKINIIGKMLKGLERNLKGRGK